MAEIIEMPRLSDTMTEGVIAAWHVKVGDKVANGDLLAEVETDKATMDVESFYDGTVLHIGIEEGKAIPVGSLLLIVGNEGEDVAELVAAAGKPATPTEEKKEETSSEEPSVQTPAPTNTSVAEPAVAVAQPAIPSTDGRVKASPLAKAMAKDKGIDLNLVEGSGDNGRIIKKDIENFVPPATVPGAGVTAFTAIPGQESFEDVAVSQMRKTIARRLSESKFSAPHFYVTMDINMDKVWVARKSMNEISPVKISFNDIVMKAAAVALKKHPKINAAWLGDAVRYNQHVHIGMAVAIDEGLLVPVVRFADQKSLSQIAAETKDLAGKARERKLQPKDWEGNTFTVSNLGMYGVEEFTAIINPPDACILAIGGIIDKAIVKDGQVVPGKMMKVTLSCDHRVVDGASGAEFLVTLKGLLEDPVRILV